MEKSPRASRSTFCRSHRRVLNWSTVGLSLAFAASCIDLTYPTSTGSWERPPAAELVASRTLPVARTFQNTPLWCWLVSGEMVFRYYAVPAVNPFDYQCGIVGILFPFQCSPNCGNCITGAGSWATVAGMIVNYPAAAQSFLGRPNRLLGATAIDAPLPDETVVAEIDAGRPILVGIDPSGFRVSNQTSEHVAVIVGYERYAHQLRFVVNDPWPYQAPEFFGHPDPYVDARGVLLNRSPQYSIASDGFRARLKWGQTIYGIR